MSTTLGIPTFYGLHPSTPKGAREWLRYPVKVKTGFHSIEGFRYFAEIGEPEIMNESYLGAEIYNAELLKVDITNDESILAFVEQFGIPVSPLYEGHQRLTWFRNRKLKPYIPALDKRSLDRRDGNFLYADLLISFNTGQMRNINPITGIPAESVLAPGIYSETARALELNSPEIKGAVSVLEVAQTIRLLQTATATCTAYQSEYEKGDISDAELPFTYLQNKRFLPIQGARYFLNDERISSFDEKCTLDAPFAASATQWKKSGNNPERDYLLMRIEALWKAAKNALLFLHNTCLVSRDELSSTAEDRFSNQVRGLFLQKPSKNLALDEAIAQYGSLTEAIALQYLTAFAADYPWQECENCGRRFKHSRGTDPHRKPRSVRFCSKSCNVSFFQKKGTAE